MIHLKEIDSKALKVYGSKVANLFAELGLTMTTGAWANYDHKLTWYRKYVITLSPNHSIYHMSLYYWLL